LKAGKIFTRTMPTWGTVLFNIYVLIYRMKIKQNETGNNSPIYIKVKDVILILYNIISRDHLDGMVNMGELEIIYTR
jgi:hypothetical protein